jgi:CBS-domain-containing membrane protein
MNMNAADILTRDILTVGPDTVVASIARLLLDHGISAVQVVDGRRRLVGLIDRKDHRWLSRS